MSYQDNCPNVRLKVIKNDGSTYDVIGRSAEWVYRNDDSACMIIGYASNMSVSRQEVELLR